MWPILYDLVQNAALLSLGVMAFIAAPGEIGWGRRPRDRAAIGIVMGSMSVLVMFASIEIAPGLIFDVRAAPILVAGMFAGWPAAVIAVVPAMAVRIWLGGSGMQIGLLALAVYAVGGAVLYWRLRQLGTNRYLWICGLGTVPISLVALSGLLLLLPDRAQGLQLYGQLGPLVTAGNLLGVVLIGAMLHMERRRRETLESLRQSEATARAALETRSRFLAGMSHEIRTPLNSVLGYAQLLSDEPLAPPARMRLSRLSSAATSLLGLIDDILDYAKIQGGQLSVVAQPTDVVACLRRSAEQVEQLSPERRVPVVLDIDRDLPPQLSLDSDRFTQIATNLIGNALKFTEAGQVTARLRHDRVAGELVLQVADTGIGMEPQDQERVFQPFERLQDINVAGTGLGLTIVRTVVRSMQGRIDLVSAPGQGSIFTVCLPCGEVEGAAGAGLRPAVSRQPDASLAPGHPNEGGADPFDVAGLSVLVVDDTPMNAEIAEAMLQRAGCTTVLAGNGAEARDAVQRQSFDLILMDIRMPVMDGYQAAIAIRALEGERAGPRQPIVALTAHASRADAQACFDAGMDAFLTKPLSRATLLRTIHALCRGDGVPPVRNAMPGEPSASQAEDLPLLDIDRLAELGQFMTAEQVTGLLAKAADTIETEAARLAGDAGADDAQQAFHRLISVAGNAGLPRLSRFCRELERDLLAGAELQRADVERYASIAASSVTMLRSYRPPGDSEEARDAAACGG